MPDVLFPFHSHQRPKTNSRHPCLIKDILLRVAQAGGVVQQTLRGHGCCHTARRSPCNDVDVDLFVFAFGAGVMAAQRLKDFIQHPSLVAAERDRPGDRDSHSSRHPLLLLPAISVRQSSAKPQHRESRPIVGQFPVSDERTSPGLGQVLAKGTRSLTAHARIA